MNRSVAFVAVVAVLVVAAAAASAQPVIPGPTPPVIPGPMPADGGCAPQPPRTVAVAFGSGFWNQAFQQAALAASLGAARKAGLTVIAPPANVVQAIPGATSPVPMNGWAPATLETPAQAICTPIVVLVMSTGPWAVFSIPSILTVSATRYSEPVAIGAVLSLPDRRIFQATSQQSAAWYSGYVPLPAITNLPIYLGGMPIASPQAAAEQQAIARGVAAVLSSLLGNITAQ